MARTLTVVISFLAQIARLGDVSGEVRRIIERVRQPIDRSLDRVVDRIVAEAQRLGRFVAQAGVPQDPATRLRLASQAAVVAASRLRGGVTVALLNPPLAAIRVRYGLTEIHPYERGGKWRARIVADSGVDQELVDAGAPGAAAGAGADRVERAFALNGVGHRLEAVGQNGRIRLYMASVREELDVKLDRHARKWSSSENQEVAASGRQLAARMGAVRQREQALAQSYLAATDPAQRHARAVAGVDEIAQMLVAIAAEFGITVEEGEIPRANPCRPGGLDLGRATGAYADPLTVASLRPRQARAQFAPGGFLNFPGRRTYAAGHLVADTFGGTNDPGNLALMSRAANGRFSSIEARVRNALRGTKKLKEPPVVLRYAVTCQFPGNAPIELEAWLQTRLSNRVVPGIRIAGVGTSLITMMARQSWSIDTIARSLNITRNQYLDLRVDDAFQARAAMLYLASGFNVLITVRAGQGVSLSGAPVSNH